jgi:NitT/TauT family transport system ATP-binding protein
VNVARLLHPVTSDLVPPTGSAVTSTAVSIRDVRKLFGHGPNTVVALDRISLDVAPGEFVCLLGASGCGKSTLLNLIAGLDNPTSGTVEVRANRTALMFQEAALFPWLTVRGNVELALKLAGTPRERRRARSEQLLEMVHLSDFAKKRPHELSGGMRQRVALARALAQDAQVLLIDEPFGALDAMTRDVLHGELEALWTTTGRTVLFVTHNVREAIRLGDRVVLLSSRPGRVADITQVHIERPRRLDSTEVATVAASITDRLREEMERHARGN